MTESNVVVVTGAGSGIGRATAQLLSERGYTLVLSDRDERGLKQTVYELNADTEPTACSVDVTDTASVAELFAQANTLPGDVRGCVHCAGIVGTSSLEDTDSSEWDRILSVNLTGTFNVLAEASKVLVTGGSIVTIASLAAQTSSNASPAYAASKAGVIGLTRSLAAPFARRGIRINSVAPGAIETSMLMEFGAAHVESLKGANPMGRLGSAAEIAATIEFLVSDASAFTTGQVISVNGGAFIG
ncbi:SDR family oxidoreductase [Rhodococcus sp. 15-649-1-2]|nr:SDR family NAD(P)-dependent oxidoreductase [Rhodococcus sp. 15-649-1-2]OZE79161.1 SDR family oxidoreductase [Rhodococcus sp. 15-649-1-2]